MSDEKLVKWPEEERTSVIGKMMDLAANLEEYQGVLIVTKDASGKPAWSWVGVPCLFTPVDVIGLCAVVEEVTKRELGNRFIDAEKKDDDGE